MGKIVSRIFRGLLLWGNACGQIIRNGTDNKGGRKVRIVLEIRRKCKITFPVYLG